MDIRNHIPNGLGIREAQVLIKEEYKPKPVELKVSKKIIVVKEVKINYPETIETYLDKLIVANDIVGVYNITVTGLPFKVTDKALETIEALNNLSLIEIVNYLLDNRIFIPRTLFDTVSNLIADYLNNYFNNILGITLTYTSASQLLTGLEEFIDYYLVNGKLKQEDLDNDLSVIFKTGVGFVNNPFNTISTVLKFTVVTEPKLSTKLKEEHRIKVTHRLLSNEVQKAILSIDVFTIRRPIIVTLDKHQFELWDSTPHDLITGSLEERLKCQN